MAIGEVVLEAKRISKAFPGVQALRDVDFDVRAGEVHAIVGENGAGKSTLMKVLVGVHHRDSGEYQLGGTTVDFRSVHQSIAAGLSCIFQELTIVPLLDVAKNIHLGHTPLLPGGRLDKKRLYAGAEEILARLDLHVPARTLARDLSVAQQQMLEIGRAISRKARVIIMDEPTSSLTEKETKILFKVIRSLVEQGIAVVYISHKLEEVMEISDRVTVFRDGQKVATLEREEFSRDLIVHHMIGRVIENYFHKVKADIGGTVLEVRGLTRSGVFTDVSFSVRRGEVVGFFGLVGAGRSEIMRAIFGVDPLEKGAVTIDGMPVTIRNTMQAVAAGLCLVPEDRKLEGLVLKLDVQTNCTLVKMNEISRLGVVDRRKEQEWARQFAEELQIRTNSLQKMTAELSGGNQQKVVISKWLMMNPKVLILDEPTRGIDVATKSEIYRLISGLAGRGVGIIVISSELPEILGICDRVITVYGGRITGDMDASVADSSTVMKAALGGGVN
jgi:rhamnose transport system ATP-binding protein